MAKKTEQFQAEINQLLNLMVHSLYSQREIFLRELISNASDALDKYKFLTLTQSDLPSEDLHIRIETDDKAKTVTISDNGIGMNRDEVVENIGTIAKSGTKEFLKRQEELKNHPELIGQFGVGFYSSFMVADKVTLHTQKYDQNTGVVWESTGDGSYTLDEVPRPQGRGTTITLKLKDISNDDDQVDFTQEWQIRSLVKKYSDFIAWPIRMRVEKSIPKKDENGNEIENEYEKEIVDETLNSQKALWLKSKSEISQDEYNDFYKHLTHDWSDPQRVIHFKAEGTMEFSALMYIPSQKPFDFNMAERGWGLNLYVRRVFIMDQCEDLIPQYLRFVKGLVDSSDLSLNVSRELLQQDRQVIAMKKSLVNKVLSELTDFLKQDRTGFETFFGNFGATLKEGIPSDFSNKDKIAKLLLYPTNNQEKMVTLDEYVQNMPSEQKEIYYITGDSKTALKASPYLERLNDKGFSVLLMTDPIDEWVVQHLTEYEGKKLVSIMSESLDLDTAEEKQKKEDEKKNLEERFSGVVSVLKESLKENVKDVKISDRLKESPVCLVSGANDPSANFEKIMSQLGQSSMKSKRILEINPNHPIFEKMQGKSKEEQQVWSDVLYGQALLAEGSELPDPLKFNQQISKLMQ